MRKLLIASSAALIIAAPAHAQILGGLGGTIGGTIQGTGSIGGPLGGPLETVRSESGGTLRGSAATHGGSSVDVKRGSVHAERNADAGVGADLTQALNVPGRANTGTAASGSGSAAGSGSADAQLIGTDVLRDTAGSVRGTAQGTTSGIVQIGRETAAPTRGLIASSTGTLSSSGSASGSGDAHHDSLTGGIAGAVQGAFTVSKGTSVLAPGGERIGKVRQVFTDARGEVRQLLVDVDGAKALLPASNFSASGSAVLSAMSEAQIERAAAQQQAAPAK